MDDSMNQEKAAQVDEESTKPQTNEMPVSDLLLRLVEKHTGFPQDSLNMDMRLLDDLNLDSIKAAEFVAEAAKSIRVEGQLDLSTFANATLAEIAETFAISTAEAARHHCHKGGF
jgi:acyl carrier protein